MHDNQLMQGIRVAGGLGNYAVSLPQSESKSSAWFVAKSEKFGPVPIGL